MNTERYSELMRDMDSSLTPEEIKQGWHFCWEFDGLLVGPGMGEQQCCTCCESNPLPAIKEEVK